MGDDTKPEEPVPAEAAPAESAAPAEVNMDATTATEKPTKRGAERQITKDDGEDAEEDEEALKGPFKKASVEVMQKRRILKVKRPSASGGGEDGAAPASSDAMPSIPEDKESSPAEAEAAPQDAPDKKEEPSGKESVDTPVTDSTDPKETDATTTAAAEPSTSSFGAAAKANPFANITFSTGSTTVAGGFGAVTKTAASTFGSSAKFGSVGSSGFAFDAASSSAAADPSADENKRASPSSLGVFGRGASITGFGATGTGTASASTGFSFGTAATTSTGVPAIGFGSTSGNGESSSSLLVGGSRNTADGESVFPSATADAADPANGEENEKCILQTRVKLYRLVEKKSTAAASSDKKDQETTKDASDESKEEENKDTDEAAADKKEEEKKDDATAAVVKEWKEVGKGPVRILKHTSEKAQYRIVQRRECSPGGAGTKLILNVMVSPTETHVERHADNHVRLTTVLAEEKCTGTFLFKVKTIAEADELNDTLTKAVKEAAEAATEAAAASDKEPAE